MVNATLLLRSFDTDPEARALGLADEADTCTLAYQILRGDHKLWLRDRGAPTFRSGGSRHVNVDS